MKDHLGRSIEYLRLSLTERCTLRCTYCRKAEGHCPKAQELSAQEFARIARVMAELGVNKIRLTGGEPMLRKDLIEIIFLLHEIPGIEELAMTTNAQHLPGMAGKLKAAGLTRLNISLDSLRPERYREMTGGDIAPVLAGIEESLQAGLLPLKLNAVLLRGVNDDEIDDFIALTKDKPVDVRFIELMPMNAEGDMSRRVPPEDILGPRPWLKPLPPRYAGQPAEEFAVDGYRGRVGLISPVSHKFCGNCNRVRVMSDGMLRPCLGYNREVSLKEALSESTDDALLRVIREAIYGKPVGHTFGEGFTPSKSMDRIGG